MQNQVWARPVKAGGMLVSGPLDAHNFLMHQWPNHKDLAWVDAENTILAALDGRVTADEARVKFEAALKSAELN